MPDELDEVLSAVGPRLRALRQRRQVTLADLSEATGISRRGTPTSDRT